MQDFVHQQQQAVRGLGYAKVETPEHDLSDSYAFCLRFGAPGVVGSRCRVRVQDGGLRVGGRATDLSLVR